MSRTKIILFAAEILAVALLRVTFMVRRDNVLPRGSKVPRINGKPVLNLKNFLKRGQPQREPQPVNLGGWTPPPKRDRIEPIPGSLPDANN